MANKPSSNRLVDDIYGLFKKGVDNCLDLDSGKETTIDRVYKAVGRSCRRFFEKYGGSFGEENQSFLAREKNIDTLITSIYVEGREPAPADLDPRGFDGAPWATAEACSFLIDVFTEELLKDRNLHRFLIKRRETSREAIDTSAGSIEDLMLETARRRSTIWPTIGSGAHRIHPGSSEHNAN